MKFSTLLFLLMVITVRAKSQINKGQFLIGGNISYESVKNEGPNAANYKTTNFFVSPNIGYFIIDKLAGGIRLNFKSYKQKTSTDLTYIYTSLSPFLRYYFFPATKKVNAFIDLGYLNYKTKYHYSSGPDNIEKTNGYSISAGPAIFLTEQIALEFTLGYKHTKLKDINASTSSIINSGLALQIHLEKSRSKSRK